MTLKELCKYSHETAIQKGFWDKIRPIPEMLMLIVSELGEALEALRKNQRQSLENKKGCLKHVACDSCKHPTECIQWEKGTFEDEIADVFIRLGDMCEALDINIEWQIKQKMQYNKNRPYKHGKEF